MGCANVAHAFRCPAGNDKLRIVAERAPHIGVVTAYNDMLSAHQPYEGFPAVIRDEAHRQGATRAGGRRRAGHVRRRHAGHCPAWS
jgi:phosphogluconate dehydratase